MSHRASEYAKTLTHDPSGAMITRREKLLLVILADYHNTTRRTAWPSISTLAVECLMDEREIRRVIVSLENRGILERVKAGQGRGHYSEYRFPDLEKRGLPDPVYEDMESGGKSGSETGAKRGSKRGSKRGPSETANKEELKQEPERELDSFSLRSKEEELEPSTDVSKELKSKPDPRHQEVKIAIERCWTLANPGAAALPWNGREAGALGQVLKGNPSWPAVDLVKCVQNRFASEVNNAERPGVWIPKLTDYFGGPLDRFNKPYGQQQTSGELRQQRNREAIVRGLGFSDRQIPRSGGVPVAADAKRGNGVILEGGVIVLPSGKG